MERTPRIETAVAQLQVLRGLLRRDDLTSTQWSAALHDFARTAQEAIRAERTMVALYDAAAERWWAYTSHGEVLDDAQIGLWGSRSVLEQVRATGDPVLTTLESPLELSSESIRLNELDSVLAVPFSWWSTERQTAGRSFAGCVYAHRTIDTAVFDRDDVELLLDITEVAQRTLNILRMLRTAESDLETSRRQLTALQRVVTAEHRLGELKTRDPWFAETVIATLHRVSYAARVTMLIMGQTGSGKTHVARAYHNECPRRHGPFVVLDCARVTSAETLAAELFGYAPQSGYVNAPPKGRVGLAQLAHLGTLFIDEIATLPRELQHRLLTLIQTGVFLPLGSAEEVTVDIQIIAATNENLEDLVQQGRFREDLYWRLSEITVTLPSLEERVADIPDLATGFLAAACARFGRTDVTGIDPSGLDVLLNHPWGRAGNVRGLEQCISRSVLLAAPRTTALEAKDIRLQALAAGVNAATRRPPTAASAPAELAAAPGPEGSPTLAEIKSAVRRHGFATAAAAALNISHGSLIWRLRREGLTVRKVLSANDANR
ncbi:MAG: sigma 54-interacting transcriptional regulator [Candidatus Schekmanbacteria bacterium]|nr:sigma 54-interacting transcriptional regulator [Candidatus Schekmanbacteria bacterium]